MIKRILPFLIILASLPCSASAFVSNALGQNLGELDALTHSGYEGESVGDCTTIYLDGEVIRKRCETDDGYTISYGDTVETVTLNDNGERREWRLETPGREEVHTYFYENGHLSSVSISVNGNLERRVVYLETPSGSIAGITGTRDAYVSPSFYLFESDGETIKFSYHSDGLVLRENLSDPSTEYEIEEDGSWKESEPLPDGSIRERIFSGSGQLIEERIGDSVTVYEYNDEGDLIKSSSENGDESTVSYYEDGRIVSSEYISGGVTTRERNYLDNGEIEEIRYRNGKPEYSILFEGDGVRVKEIHRL